MFSNKEAIIQANIDYLQAEGRTSNFPEAASQIKSGLRAAEIYTSRKSQKTLNPTPRSPFNIIERGYRQVSKDELDMIALEIIGSTKLLQALNKGYSLLATEFAIGAYNFDYLTQDPRIYRALPRTVIEKYGKAIDTNFFDQFFFKASPKTPEGYDHVLLGGIKTSNLASVESRKKSAPIEKIDGFAVLKVA